MKLRNKKTGFIGNLISGVNMVDYQIATDDYTLLDRCNSLKEINEEWEDYEPAKPLIKDPKIRKAVRAWAEANNVTKVWHEGNSVGFCDGAVSIKFHELCWEEIPKGEYTIAELCGEEG